MKEIGGEFGSYFNNEFNEREMLEEFKYGLIKFNSGGVDKEAMKNHAFQL